ncbi:hypothetical protein Tsubulata_010586 [Turnera subulata]|uniref:J domain-containing protein n=1 Tax=Turnera subulata TaxID=218843 RepID=A0A9Q0JLJ2_9ROSI|nr:hypothetical protein Tsubulata_010586 [Turnera subulata]
MLHLKNSILETYYDVLAVKEDASHEEIRASYRSAILNHHPDKQQSTDQALAPQNELGDRFLEIQKAWEVLGNSRSRAIYDSELGGIRQDADVAEDISLVDMTIEDSGDVLELFHQCRCGDYFSVDSLELRKMGYLLLKDESEIGFETPDALPASVVLPCGSCSLRVRLLINTDTRVPIYDNL